MVAAVLSGAGVPSPAEAQIATHPVMGRSRVTAADLAGWYRSTGQVSRATVSIDQLAAYFIQEGRDEEVAGDLAFAQSIVETGYFRFSDRVLPSFNNFSGLGAVDSGTSAEMFPTARIGVRAQIQHLRVYADPTATASNLAHPLVDTRFHLVRPPGKATTWEEFGGGIWATDPGYAAKVLRIHGQIVEWARRHGADRFAPHATAGAFAVQGYRDILFREPGPGEQQLWRTTLQSGDTTPPRFMATLWEDAAAQTSRPLARLYRAALDRMPERDGLIFWSGRLHRGTSIQEVATFVIRSPEYERRFGDPSNIEYVELLYRNVLSRLPDPSGRQFWLDRLGRDTVTRTDMLVEFSESAENRRRTATDIEVAVLSIGMLRRDLAADDLRWWRERKGVGEPIETLIFYFLSDPRYAARF